MHSLRLQAQRSVVRLTPITVLAYFVLLPAIALAEDIQPAGHHVPPDLALARVVNTNVIEVLTFHERVIMRTVSPVGSRAPASSAAPQTFESVPIAEAVIVRLKVNDVEARRMDGNLVPGETLASQLTTFKPILFCRSPIRSVEAFKSVFNPQTIVLTVRTQSPTTVVPPNTAVPQTIAQ